MFLSVLVISTLMFGIQIFMYHKQFHKQFLYILPIASLGYMIYVIFKTVRAQALVPSSFPLAIRVVLTLSPILFALFGMLGCIVKKYYHMKQKGPLRYLVLRQFLGFLAVMIILLFVTIYTAQEYVIFFPNKNEEAYTTLSKEDKFEHIIINDTYQGWLMNSHQSDTILVYFGGNAQNTASTFLEFETLGIFSEMEPYSFLSVDNGNSEGSLSQEALFTMADAVMQEVQQRYPDKKIDVIGYSIGSGIACYAASHYDIHKFVLIAPYNNGKDLYNSYFPIFHGPFQYLIRYTLPSDQYVEQITCDSMVMMSQADEIVRVNLSEKLITHFPTPPTTIIYQEDSHADLVTEYKPWKEIIDFLKQTS